jgi:hypothetical protein
VAAASPSASEPWQDSLDLGGVVISRLAMVAAVVVAEVAMLWLEEHISVWMGVTGALIYPVAHFVVSWILVLFDVALLATVAVKSLHDVVEAVLGSRRRVAGRDAAP